MGELRIIKENPDEKYIIVKVKGRKSPLRIYVPEFNQFGFWEIRYHDTNQKVPGLQGSYISKQEALRAVKKWATRIKPTIDAKSEERFGDKPIPVLKRKKISGSKSK